MGTDVVTKPSHYRHGKVETITLIKGSMSPEAFKGFLRGNIFKYLSRYPYKNGVEDLKKAQQYLNWLIKEEEKDAHS